MLKRIPLVLASVLVAFACTDTVTQPDVEQSQAEAQFGARIVHSVSVGGADVCTAFGDQPGCDANFSLAAVADGFEKGQWQDTFGGAGGNPATPIHLQIDCLYVEGNQAWVSGVVTGGVFDGLPAVTRIEDNGPNNGISAPDMISFTFLGDDRRCDTHPDLPLFPLNEGQVVVR